MLCHSGKLLLKNYKNRDFDQQMWSIHDTKNLSVLLTDVKREIKNYYIKNTNWIKHQVLSSSKDNSNLYWILEWIARIKNFLVTVCCGTGNFRALLVFYSNRC